MFKDRADAGRQLAEKLASLKGEDAVVYALPRGGVVLGAEIARAISAPLDLVITRKIGHPHNHEYAVCAVSESGELLCNEYEQNTLDPSWLSREAEAEKQEALRRRKTYLGGKLSLSAEGKTAIVVDDGVATGLTIRLAIREIRKQKPARIIVAIPVVSQDIAQILKKEADEIVALEAGADFLGAVGAYYETFPQVSDEEVVTILNAHSSF